MQSPCQTVGGLPDELHSRDAADRLLGFFDSIVGRIFPAFRGPDQFDHLDGLHVFPGGVRLGKGMRGAYPMWHEDCYEEKRGPDRGRSRCAPKGAEENEYLIIKEARMAKLGFLRGALLGLMAGLLVAPRSGKEMRENIKKHYEEISDRISEELSRFKDITQETYTCLLYTSPSPRD